MVCIWVSILLIIPLYAFHVMSHHADLYKNNRIPSFIIHNTNNNNNSSRCDEGTKPITVIRCRPDLRLAESYVPAALLIFKVLMYTFMVPMVASFQERFGLLIVAFFMMLLYVDHIYFVIPTIVFIDTTAIALDVVMSTICMLLLGMISGHYTVPYPWVCTIILSVWGCSGAMYILTIGIKKNKAKYRVLVHIIAFSSLMLFIFMWTMEEGGISSQRVSLNVTDRFQSGAQQYKGVANTVQPLHFYLRNLFYSILILTDSYSFRPLFQQENERFFFCKYGAILFSYWQFATLFFCVMIAVQILKVSHYIEWMTEQKYEESLDSPSIENPKHLQDLFSFSSSSVSVNGNNNSDATFQGPSDPMDSSIHHSNTHHEHHNSCHNGTFQSCITISASNNAASATAVVDQDVMEAFRIAKQQYNTAHHGGKTN